MNTDTNQSELKRNEKGHFAGGTPPAGFNTHPENRHNGAWKKEDTPRFKLEQMMGLSKIQLQELIDEPTTPAFEERMATAVLKGQWKEIEGMINQVYGKPKESIDLSNPDGSLTPIVRIIDERNQTT